MNTKNMRLLALLAIVASGFQSGTYLVAMHALEWEEDFPVSSPALSRESSTESVIGEGVMEEAQEMLQQWMTDDPDLSRAGLRKKILSMSVTDAHASQLKQALLQLHMKPVEEPTAAIGARKKPAHATAKRVGPVGGTPSQQRAMARRKAAAAKAKPAAAGERSLTGGGKGPGKEEPRLGQRGLLMLPEPGAEEEVKALEFVEGEEFSEGEESTPSSAVMGARKPAHATAKRVGPVGGTPSQQRAIARRKAAAAAEATKRGAPKFGEPDLR